MILPNDIEAKPYEHNPYGSAAPELLRKKSHRFSSSFPNTRSAFMLSRHKWRWWHYLSFLIILIALMEAAALVTGYTVLQNEAAPVRIAMRQYRPMPYKHIESTSLSPFPAGSTIYHVTKEFGPSSVGNIGVTVTALAAAQQRTGDVNVRIVMPYYSFFKNRYAMDKVTDLVIDLRDNKGRLLPMEVKVWKMMYVFNPKPPPPNITVWEMIDGVNTSVSVAPPYEPVPVPLTEQVPVFLIGPGNRKPFSQSFRVRNAFHIYTTDIPGLPSEWETLYFSKAAAAFLTHQAAATDEESLFAPIRKTPHVDIVHIHGAELGYIAKHLDDKRRDNQLGAQPPSVVFTMHNYLEDTRHSVAKNSVQKFLDKRESALGIHTLGQRTFLADIGIAYANAVTVPSRSMASDIVEGRNNLVREVIMDSLIQKTRSQRFFGISNGLDVQQLNPFMDERLVSRKLAFPQYALALVEKQRPLAQDSEAIATVWRLSAYPNDYLTTAKDRAKRFLARRNLISESDLTRALVLFVGQFQYENGLDRFEEAAALFVQHDMKFIILGFPGDYPLEKVEALQTRYPDHVVVMSTTKQIRQWSIFCRAAADLTFVPSRTEAFGLSASEGLLFGAAVIGTDVGVLKEFLIDRPAQTQEGVYDIHVSTNARNVPTVTSAEDYNAYLITSSLAAAVRDAAMDFARHRDKNYREEYTLRMVRAAFSLRWDGGNGLGPVHEYLNVYKMALSDRSIPALSIHELEQEEALLERLKQHRLRTGRSVD